MACYFQPNMSFSAFSEWRNSYCMQTGGVTRGRLCRQRDQAGEHLTAVPDRACFMRQSAASGRPAVKSEPDDSVEITLAYTRYAQGNRLSMSEDLLRCSSGGQRRDRTADAGLFRAALYH